MPLPQPCPGICPAIDMQKERKLGRAHVGSKGGGARKEMGGRRKRKGLKGGGGKELLFLPSAVQASSCLALEIGGAAQWFAWDPQLGKQRKGQSPPPTHPQKSRPNPGKSEAFPGSEGSIGIEKGWGELYLRSQDVLLEVEGQSCSRCSRPCRGHHRVVQPGDSGRGP